MFIIIMMFVEGQLQSACACIIHLAGFLILDAFTWLKHLFLLFVFAAGDEEPPETVPAWAAEEEDDPENRYGSKSLDIEFEKQLRCGRKVAPSKPNLSARSSNTRVIKTQLQSIQTRPKRSCSRAPEIKYTF